MLNFSHESLKMHDVLDKKYLKHWLDYILLQYIYMMQNL
jgi:hypothetical protein